MSTEWPRPLFYTRLQDLPDGVDWDVIAIETERLERCFVAAEERQSIHRGTDEGSIFDEDLGVSNGADVEEGSEHDTWVEDEDGEALHEARRRGSRRRKRSQSAKRSRCHKNAKKGKLSPSKTIVPGAIPQGLNPQSLTDAEAQILRMQVAVLQSEKSDALRRSRLSEKRLKNEMHQNKVAARRRQAWSAAQKRKNKLSQKIVQRKAEGEKKKLREGSCKKGSTEEARCSGDTKKNIARKKAKSRRRLESRSNMRGMQCGKARKKGARNPVA
jgi:hypothetical protein